MQTWNRQVRLHQCIRLLSRNCENLQTRIQGKVVIDFYQNFAQFQNRFCYFVELPWNIYNHDNNVIARPLPTTIFCSQKWPLQQISALTTINISDYYGVPVNRTMFIVCDFLLLNVEIMKVLVYICLLMLLYGIYFLWTKSKRDPIWPPGPPTIPFIGNLNIDLTDRISAFRKLRQQYGDIFSLILGSQTVVVVSGVDTLKELFIKHGDVVSVRPDIFVFREISHYKGNNGMAMHFNVTCVNDNYTYCLGLLTETLIRMGKLKKEIYHFHW